jgi:hypothetical protein
VRAAETVARASRGYDPGKKVLEELREQIRLQAGRDAEPTAGIIDSQSVKGADTVGRESRGYDAGKKGQRP